MPKWSAKDYGIGYLDGKQDIAFDVDRQWDLLGTITTCDSRDESYWDGYHDGRHNWNDKRYVPAWAKYFH